MKNEPYKNITTNHRWLNSIKKITPMILAISCSHRGHLTESMHKLVKHLLQHKGEKRTLELLKAYRVFLNQTLLNQEVTNLPFHKVVRSGEPKVLKDWLPLLHGKVEHHRLLLSVWRVIDAFKLPLDMNTSTIVEGFTGNMLEIARFLVWLPTWSIIKASAKINGEDRFIMSNRAGPNGPATATAYKDLSALRQTRLYPLVRSMVKNSHRFDLTHEDGYPGDYYHSRIVFLPDNAGKTRVIAIGDYWSNAALQPLHDKVMKVLRTMRSDVTFRQSCIPNLIKGLGNKLYTSDLTAFTDRLPMFLTEGVVSELCGTQYGVSWSKVISGRSFTLPNGKEIRYAVGNPMGLLSSWAVSSLTHHAIKEWCAHLCGVKRYKYLILGDDCLDTNKEVYNVYLSKMKKFGLEISLGKCTQSESGNAEFAKRLFTPKNEITGLPVNLLKDVQHKPEQLIELVRIMRSRGYLDDTITPGIQSLIRKWKNHTLISLVLSAPEELLGMQPLQVGNTEEGQFNWPSGTFLNKCIEHARSILFWREVDKVESVLKSTDTAPPNKRARRIDIQDNHVLIGELGLKVKPLLRHFLKGGPYRRKTDEDDYSVWNDWMEGKSYELININTPNNYLYANRGHKATKCRYEVIKLIISLSRGNALTPLLPIRERISDRELFELGFSTSRLPTG
jgi:hypothetical protein